MTFLKPFLPKLRKDSPLCASFLQNSTFLEYVNGFLSHHMPQELKLLKGDIKSNGGRPSMSLRQFYSLP